MRLDGILVRGAAAALAAAVITGVSGAGAAGDARAQGGAPAPAAPVSHDTAPPRLVARIARPQQPLATGGVAVRVRCPDGDCLAGATVTVPVPGSDAARLVEAVPIEPPTRRFATLVVRLPRPIRRELAHAESVRAAVTAVAADLSGNVTRRSRVVRLTG